MASWETHEIEWAIHYWGSVVEECKAARETLMRPRLEALIEDAKDRLQRRRIYHG